MKFTDYRIVRGDTLESIALALFGDAGNWRLLATFNRLRYPFISDDPVAQYGSPLDSLVTTVAINVADPSFTLALPLAVNEWVTGNVFYIQKIGSDGSVIYDALTIKQNADPATGVLLFTTPFANAYPVGTAAFLFIRPGEIRTQVLKTGDPLRVPSTATGDIITTGDAAFVSLLGTDVQLDASGQITFDANGDLTLTSGINNLIQALRIRLNTPVATLPYSPDYGNQVFDHLGEAGSPYFYNLMAALVSRTLVADSRIDAVTDVKVTQRGVTLLVDATVRIRSGSSLLRLQNLALGPVIGG